MNRMNPRLSLLLWLFAVTQARAIDDISAGGFLWLQGYDLNPPTHGFRIDGQLRIESTDEPQPVGINLSSGEVTNSPAGVIYVNNGPGGARFIAGDLWNDGLVTLNSVLLFDRDDAEVVNRGLFEAAPFSGAAVTGRRGIFRQVAGAVRFADSSSRFEFYHGSRFIYEGGNVFGEPLLAGSTAVISPAVTTDVSLRFVGVGSVYDGAITTNRTVKLAIAS